MGVTSDSAQVLSVRDIKVVVASGEFLPRMSELLRGHRVNRTNAFVSLAHTVFNAGLGAACETNQAELRYFVLVAEWTKRLQAIGLKDAGQRLAQAHDPSDNLLMAFVK